MLQSNQDNDIAHVLEQDLHILEITGNLSFLCLVPLVCLIWVLVPKALGGLYGGLLDFPSGVSQSRLP